MKRTVKYNDEHEPYAIHVDAVSTVGLEAHFTFDAVSGVATLTYMTPREGECDVYADDLKYVMDDVADLPMVDAVELDDYDEPL
jgi:hypothetical protein